MLEVCDLTVTLGSTRSLRDVTLTVPAGKIVALSGEPGAGKTVLVRTIAGELTPSAGSVTIDGRPLPASPPAVQRLGLGVVWQDLALCENLDVAGNLLLGREHPRVLRSQARFHAAARSVLRELGITLGDTTRLAADLPSGERRLLALAMALSRRPGVLVLDEPTAALGAGETADLEHLLAEQRARGVAILLATRDIGQMFRIADRIVVLRSGRVQAELDPANAHPDDVAALLAGRRPDATARHQLTRLHGLADSLALADASSGLALIVGALAAALGVDRSRVTISADGVDPGEPGARGWVVPIKAGRAGVVLSVDRDTPEPPSKDERDLLDLYAGYAAAAIERLHAESTQREAAALRRSRELQREFLGRLSHELRTPLTAIRGYASSLAAPDVEWDADSQQRFLERIAVESARLGRLVDDLLDFSAIESGVLRVSPDWCELPLVLQAAVLVLPPEWQSRVTDRLGYDLPPVWADHDRLEQVFVNLIGNALRHNPPGTTVTVGAAENGDGTVTITVADDGIGFPPEIGAAPFESSGRPRSRTAGAGLGLSITRGIVAAHGGTIRLRPGDPGSRFEITIPIEAARPAELEAIEHV
jgi:signal transduction histidine kinase